MPATSLRRRVVSGAIDVFVAILVTIGIGIISGSAAPILDPLPTTTAREINAAYFDFFWMTIFFFAAYGAVFEVATGITMGKFITSTRAVNVDDEPMTRDRALMLNIAKLASVYVFGLGIIWALIDRQNRTWHDLMAGTYVGDDP